MFLSRFISSSSLEDFFLVYYAILLKSISLAVQMLWIPQLECFCHVVADAKWWDERETLWLCSPTAFNWIKIELIKDLKGVRAVLKHFLALFKVNQSRVVKCLSGTWMLNHGLLNVNYTITISAFDAQHLGFRKIRRCDVAKCWGCFL